MISLFSKCFQRGGKTNNNNNNDVPTDFEKGQHGGNNRRSNGSQDSDNASGARIRRAINLLPTTAKVYYRDDHGSNRNNDGNYKPIGQWNEILKVLFLGTRSCDHPNQQQSALVLLRNHEDTILRKIYGYIALDDFLEHVKLTLPYSMVFSHGYLCNDNAAIRRWYSNERIPRDFSSSGFQDGFVAFASCGKVHFPPPKDRNINMMPFILGDRNSLPDDLQCYFWLIEECPYLRDEETGNVAYLTVHECYVEAGQTQRRPGLHIEAPGNFLTEPIAAIFRPADVLYGWGGGAFYGRDRYEGGIYIASNIRHTTQVWDALIDKDATTTGAMVVDRHGGCGHLRDILGPSTKLEAGELVWMTDRTPHESLPMEESGYRQFFRVVSPRISHWFADHSTPNPKVPIPQHVKIVYGNKFS